MSNLSGDGAGLAPLVELRSVTKNFGGIKALKGVDLLIPRGTVVGLAGENGAGKSTLLKVLCGIHRPNSGSLTIDGKKYDFVTPAEAKKLGISVVAQELSVIKHLTVAENIALGQEPTKFGMISRKAERDNARDALSRVNSTIDPDDYIRDLAFPDRQLVEIAKALVTNPRVLILDEPTSGLQEEEVASLLTLVKQLKEQGTSIVFITHRMSELFEVCDVITVLKDGESVGQVKVEDVTPDDIVAMMVGRQIDTVFPTKLGATPEDTPGLLSVRGLQVRSTSISGLDIDIRPGEVLGISGLAGNGQADLLDGLAGVKVCHGDFVRDGKKIKPFKKPKDSTKVGIALSPEDRKNNGLILDATVGWNLTLPIIDTITKGGFVSVSKEKEAVEKVADQLGLVPRDGSGLAGALSGGNQQKVVIGKALLAQPKIYLFSDPTRGIDVRTKTQIYELINSLAHDGNAVVLYSTDLTEIVGVCDRVLVMSSGKVVAELKDSDITEESVTKAAFSGGAQ